LQPSWIKYDKTNLIHRRNPGEWKKHARKEREYSPYRQLGLGGYDGGSKVGVKIFYSTAGKMAVFS